MLAAGETVFLIDVDNTLLDNDRFAADLTGHLEATFGAAGRKRYWTIFDEVRVALGYADYLETLQQFRIGLDGDPRLLWMSEFLLEYPFADRVYRHAIEAAAHLRTLGLTVILSDGDMVFQPRKIQRSGLWAAVDGRVLVYVHKERMLADVRRRFPASHYVIVDDKPQLLAAMKRVLGETLTTIFVRQGHYAAGSAGSALDPAPDATIDHIGELCRLGAAGSLPATSIGAQPPIAGTQFPEHP